MPGDNEIDLTVKGIPELARAVTKIEKNFDVDFKGAAAQVARDVVAGARQRAASRQQQLAASTLNAGVRGSAGTVTSNSPIFPGAEFGGGMRSTTRQFPPYRGKRGYFLYPSIRSNAARLNKIWDGALQDAMDPWDYTPR